VIPLIRGQAGSSEVELSDFPYKACPCGRLAEWAFDPGLEFSTQLFGDGGIATAKGRHGAPQCRGCGADLGLLEPVSLTASARLDGFVPISMTLRANGYRCDTCGLTQLPPGDLDIGRWGARSTDTGRALDAAIESVGLST
jgi:hypothetical protein